MLECKASMSINPIIDRVVATGNAFEAYVDDVVAVVDSRKTNNFQYNLESMGWWVSVA